MAWDDALIGNSGGAPAQGAWDSALVPSNNIPPPPQAPTSPQASPAPTELLPPPRTKAVVTPDKLLDANPQQNDAGEVLYHDASGKLVPTNSAQHVLVQGNNGPEVWSGHQEQQEAPISEQPIGERLTQLFSPLRWLTNTVGAANTAVDTGKKYIEGQPITPDEETNMANSIMGLSQVSGLFQPGKTFSLGSQMPIKRAFEKITKPLPPAEGDAAAAVEGAGSVPPRQLPFETEDVRGFANTAMDVAQLFGFHGAPIVRLGMKYGPTLYGKFKDWYEQAPEAQTLQKAQKANATTPNKVSQMVLDRAQQKAANAFTASAFNPENIVQGTEPPGP